jgi:salicylate 5-hydroxylase large subunit
MTPPAATGALTERTIDRTWPAAGTNRVPYWLYHDPELYALEQDRIFRGPGWTFVGLAAEVPSAGEFRRAWFGSESVVLVRAKDGTINVLPNRCAHRGVQFCRETSGTTTSFTCPYHQWTYDLGGRLLGVPFRKGVNGQGGMPSDFRPVEHSLDRLAVHVRNGVVFATVDPTTPSFEEYLGATMLNYFDRVFDGRELRVLGYSRQRIPANWKLMVENIKDPYHASLLHVFLVSFGLFRADNPSETRMDPTGRHSVLVSSRRQETSSTDVAALSSFTALKLEDDRLLDPVREFPGTATVVMQTLWPNLIVQQQSNTLALRQIVPRGPESFDLMWTYFGYADDDDEMVTRRLRQANLMGPAGLVSLDDSEVMQLAQQGVTARPDGESMLDVGLGDDGDVDHIVTEVAIREFYRHYREVMGL